MGKEKIIDTNGRKLYVNVSTHYLVIWHLLTKIFRDKCSDLLPPRSGPAYVRPYGTVSLVNRRTA